MARWSVLVRAYYGTFESRLTFSFQTWGGDWFGSVPVPQELYGLHRSDYRVRSDIAI